MTQPIPMTLMLSKQQIATYQTKYYLIINFVTTIMVTEISRTFLSIHRLCLINEQIETIFTSQGMFLHEMQIIEAN